MTLEKEDDDKVIEILVKPAENKMSKVRGKYKQYLYDNDKVIPTKWYAKHNSSLINNEIFAARQNQLF